MKQSDINMYECYSIGCKGTPVVISTWDGEEADEYGLELPWCESCNDVTSMVEKNRRPWSNLNADDFWKELNS